MSSTIVCPGHTMDGRSFISAAHDKTALIRDSATGNWLHKLEGHKGAVWAAKLDASGRFAATGSGDSSARLWALEPVEDGASYNRPATVHEFVHKKVVRTVEFSPDSQYLVTGGYEGALRIFDLARGGAEPWLLEHTSPLSATSTSPTAARVKKIVWSADGRSLLTGDDGGVLRQWDVASLKCVRELRVAPPASANGVADIEQTLGGRLLVVSAGQRVAVVDAAAFAELRAVDAGGDVETASLHPNRRHLVVGGVDTVVRIFDMEALLARGDKPGGAAEGGIGGNPPNALIRGHHGKVHCLRFDPEGRTLVSGADDATVRMWGFSEALQAGTALAVKERGGPGVLLAGGGASGGGGGAPVEGGGSRGSGGGGGGSPLRPSDVGRAAAAAAGAAPPPPPPPSSAEIEAFALGMPRSQGGAAAPAPPLFSAERGRRVAPSALFGGNGGGGGGGLFGGSGALAEDGEGGGGGGGRGAGGAFSAAAAGSVAAAAASASAAQLQQLWGAASAPPALPPSEDPAAVRAAVTLSLQRRAVFKSQLAALPAEQREAAVAQFRAAEAMQLGPAGQALLLQLQLRQQQQQQTLKDQHARLVEQYQGQRAKLQSLRELAQQPQAASPAVRELLEQEARGVVLAMQTLQQQIHSIQKQWAAGGGGQ